jgi:hypothetical protein
MLQALQCCKPCNAIASLAGVIEPLGICGNAVLMDNECPFGIVWSLNVNEGVSSLQ